jgi:hypothetical protein
MRDTRKRAHLLHFETQDPELDRLLKPGATYRSPEDVVKDTSLSLSEKKAILASWASDACAVDSRPAFRQPAGFPEPVSFDSIMRALQDLDRTPSPRSVDSARRRDGGDRSPLC